jgi:phosphoglycolate phosphatase
MRPDSYSAVVFDLDGTLIDGSPDITDAINRALHPYAIEPFTPLEVATFLGGGPTALIDHCLASRSLPLSTRDKRSILAEYTNFYLAAPSAKTQILGAADIALPLLIDKGIQLGICTNKRTGIANRVLQDLKLDGFMSCVVGSDSVNHVKPNPLHLLECLTLLGTSPEDALYVGDTDIDYQTAYAAGVDYAHVTWGRPIPHPFRQIHSFIDLANFTPKGAK